MFEEKVSTTVAAIDGLAAALTAGLFARLAEVDAPLQQERDAKAAEARALRESHEQLQPRVEAQVRILGGEADRAFAEGRDNDAEAKKREAAERERNLADILSRAEACDRRVWDLELEQMGNSRAIFEETFPGIREGTVAVETALVRMLDTVWAELVRYGEESGHTGSLGVPALVRSQHMADLTPHEYPPEKAAFESLREWFGGRTR